MVQVLTLEASSLAVKVMSCGPRPRLVPGAGLWLSETWLHASVTLHSPVRSGSTSRQLALAASERLVGHRLNTGGVSSITVSTAELVALNPLVSVTVNVSVLVLKPSSVPATGLWLML